MWLIKIPPSKGEPILSFRPVLITARMMVLKIRKQSFLPGFGGLKCLTIKYTVIIPWVQSGSVFLFRFKLKLLTQFPAWNEIKTWISTKNRSLKCVKAKYVRSFSGPGLGPRESWHWYRSLRIQGVACATYVRAHSTLVRERRVQTEKLKL